MLQDFEMIVEAQLPKEIKRFKIIVVLQVSAVTEM